jgi:hypothetical protein
LIRVSLILSKSEILTRGNAMNKNITQNVREFTRIPIHVMVEVKAGEVVIKTEKTIDLSMKGVSFLSDIVLPVDTDCTVLILLGNEKKGININVKGRVSWSSDSKMAIEFTKIDLDSYEYLQNLVMHNSNASHDTVEGEIHDHLGLKRRG